MERMHQVRNETIIVFPYTPEIDRVLVIGRVIKIEKGRELDVVWLNTGNGVGETFTRKIVAKSINSRKQISTLKIDINTFVFGEIPKYVRNTTRQGVMIINAIAFWSAYVPNHYDRMEMESEQEQQENIKKMGDIQEEETIGDFLSQFENR